MPGRFTEKGTFETERRRALVTLFTVVLLGTWTVSSWAMDEINAVKLRRDQLAGGWRLVNEFPIPEERVQPFRAKFFAPINRMLYQAIRVEGSGEIRIHYASCPNEKQTATLYQKMIELVGNQNVVVRRGRVVVEIISGEPSLKEAVLDRLPLSSVQRRKLRSTSMPPGWKLVSEAFVAQTDLEPFEKRFDVRLEEILNQFLFVNQQRLRVNYLAVQREEDAQKVFEKMVELVGNSNLLLKKGKIIVEGITETPEMKTEVASLLDRFVR